MKNSVRTLVGVAVGGAAMQAVSNSSMPQGMKDVTNLGIGVGIMGNALQGSGLFSERRTHHHKIEWRKHK